MGNPFRNHDQEHDLSVSACTVLALKHNSGISMDWTLEEQVVLDEGLVKYASECNVKRYTKIASRLKNKTVRDVALRISWMNIEKVSDPAVQSSHFAARPTVSPYDPATIMMDDDDGIPYQAIGGLAGELLEQNTRALYRISANLSAHQIQENIPLFCQVRDNIRTLLNEVKVVPEVMKLMPPFLFNINETIANSILPETISGDKKDLDLDKKE